MMGGKQKRLVINYHIVHAGADGVGADDHQTGKDFLPDDVPHLVMEFRSKLRELQKQIERCKVDFASKVEAYSELKIPIELLQSPRQATPEKRAELIIWLEGFMQGTSKVMNLAKKTKEMETLLDWLEDHAGAVLKILIEQ